MDEVRAVANISSGLVDSVRQVHSPRNASHPLPGPASSACGVRAYRRAWDARGRNFSLYKADRPVPCAHKPSVHTELIHVDAGSKMSVSHKVCPSPKSVSQSVTTAVLAGSTWLTR